MTANNTSQELTVDQIKSQFNKEENRLFESLMRLGDPMKLAYETVLNERNKQDKEVIESYRFAYEN